MKESVWLVDDDENVRKALEQLLTLLGYEVLGFSSPRGAAGVIKSGWRPTLLFLDINLPEVSGIQFLKTLRELPGWDRVPVLMVSADSAVESVEAAITQGADGYVFKPVTYDELRMAIKTAVVRRKAVQEKKTPE